MKQYWQILRDIREDHDLRQEDVAKLLGTTQQAYSRYENGLTEMPIKHIVTLCRYYRISADYVLGLRKGQKDKDDSAR